MEVTNVERTVSSTDAGELVGLEKNHGLDATEVHEPEHVPSPAFRVANLLAVILPLIGLIAAMVLMWGEHFNWLYLGLLVGFYVATAVGITVGFHRLFTHRAFETVWPVRAGFAILGSMAVQGPLIDWVAWHRRHHQHSDHDGDPHSPHLHGEGVGGMLKGMIHAHFGWMLWENDTGQEKYVGDLLREKRLMKIQNLFGLWAILGLVLPAIIAGLVTMSWMGALLGFLWGGLARLFLVHHVTWSVNSICHIWGAQPFGSKDESRNNVVVGILAMGEGWHNSHHAFPTSARHGLSWWQLDISYLIIKTLSLLGLAWKVKVPSAEAIEAKRNARARNDAAAAAAAAAASKEGSINLDAAAFTGNKPAHD
jgi:stearoyl-CoA desaturase (delta-9 desaturase)